MGSEAKEPVKLESDASVGADLRSLPAGRLACWSEPLAILESALVNRLKDEFDRVSRPVLGSD